MLQTEYIDTYRRILKRSLAEMERRLSDLADEMAGYQRQLDQIPEPGASNFSSVISSAQSRVLWGVANLNLEALTVTASDADVELERQRRAEELEVEK